jgi:uncharacterized phosphosugar-binding protein
MLHAVISQSIAYLIEEGITPPIFLSGNLDGADERNQRLLKEYKDRITYL